MQKSLIAMNVQLQQCPKRYRRYEWTADYPGSAGGAARPKTLAALRDRRCMASEEEIVHSLQGVWKPDVLV
jgi:hypothetical protein